MKKSKHSKRKRKSGSPSYRVSHQDVKALKEKEPSSWTIRDVQVWLYSINLSQYQNTFEENQIGGEELLDLVEDDFKNMGIMAVGHLKKLRRRISKLKGITLEKQQQETTTSSESATHSVGTLTIKCVLSNNSIRVIKVDVDEPWGSTEKRIKALCENKHSRIKYKDNDGDYLSLRTQEDWKDAKEQSSTANRVRVYIAESKSKKSSSSTLIVKPLFDLFDTLLDPILIINASGIIQYMNKAAEKFTGYAASELRYKNVKQLMTSDFRPYHDNYLRNYRSTGTSKIIGRGRDLVFQKKDGSIQAAHLELTEQTINNVHYFIGTFKKVKEDVQAKSILQQEREVLNNLTVAAIVIDEAGVMHAFNTPAQKLLGYKLIDVVGKNVKMLMTKAESDKHDTYLDNYKRTKERKVIGMGRQVVAQCRDGTLKTVQLSVTEKMDHKNKQHIFTGILQCV